MLHNSEPFGPNEVPTNIGVPINMTQISGPMNITQNLSNLGKIGPQTTQSSNSNYNITNYHHLPLNMSSQISQFPNYNQSAFQSNFTHYNNSLHNASWENGLPMDLNVNSSQETNDPSHQLEIDKKPTEASFQSDFKEPNLCRTPLNIPQVNSPYHNIHKSDHNFAVPSCNYRNYTESSSSMNKIEIDETRRKSLENTVKFIENILISTSKNSQMNRESKTLDGKHLEKKSDPLLMELENKDGYDTSDEELDNDKFNVTIESDNEQESSAESEEDVKPVITEKFEEVHVNNVEIKVEPLSSWTDIDNPNPFLRDVNIIKRDDERMMDLRIIDSENSVKEATENIKLEKKEKVCYQCPHCNGYFLNPKRFLIHTKWHSFGLTNTKRLETAKEKEHARNMRKEERFKQRLVAKEVTEPDAGLKTFPCKECDKVFSTKGSLKNHRQRIHPNRVRECKICKKTVLGWIALRAHLSTHTVDSGFQCTDCPKKFKYAHSLAKHRDTHLEKTHPCDQCEKKFGSAALLNTHMKVHERLQRGATFRCTYCAKGFFESYSLQVHERTHRNERPYLCHICKTSFGTNSSLKRHLRVSHSSTKPYVCSTCHRSFVTETIRDRHEQRAHGNPEDFKFICKQCPCKYFKQKDLQKHVYKVHPKGKRKRKSKADDTQSDSE